MVVGDSQPHLLLKIQDRISLSLLGLHHTLFSGGGTQRTLGNSMLRISKVRNNLRDLLMARTVVLFRLIVITGFWGDCDCRLGWIVAHNLRESILCSYKESRSLKRGFSDAKVNSILAGNFQQTSRPIGIERLIRN